MGSARAPQSRVQQSRAPQSRGFASLVALAKSAEQGRADDFVAALHAVAEPTLLRAAARHRCLGYIRRSIYALRVRDPQAFAIAHRLRDYNVKAAVQAYATRAQIEELARTLNDAAIPFALLKGAARLFRGERDADAELTDDIDLLVPRADGERSAALLESRGYQSYRAELGERQSAYYHKHHHLAPLIPPQPGLPVELHTELMPAGAYSMTFDWDACTPYFERVIMGRNEAACFNPLGTAIHLTLHCEGVKRLRDVILLSRVLRSDATIYNMVLAAIRPERRQRNALEAVLALAAELAGLDIAQSREAQGYLRWALRREDLPAAIRERCQLADVWHAGRAALWWPALRRALLPDELEERRNGAQSAWRSTLRIASRIGASAYAALAYHAPSGAS